MQILPFCRSLSAYSRQYALLYVDSERQNLH